MIRHIENRNNAFLDRDNSTRSASAYFSNPIQPSTIIPEMFGYSQDGFSLSSPSNNISNPIYNAFNTLWGECNLGSFNEVKTIEVTFPKRVRVSALQIDVSGNAGVFGVELSVPIGSNSWKTIGAYCVGSSAVNLYQDIVAIDSLIGFSQSISSPSAFLSVRDLQFSTKLRISFSPYNSTTTPLSLKHISIMDADCVEYFNDELQERFNYACDTFDASFSTLGNLNCLVFGNQTSSFGYLRYFPSTISAMEEFSLCFAFFPRQISQNETYCLFSRTSRVLNVQLDSSMLFVECNGAMAQAPLPKGFFGNWHTMCISYSNSKLIVWLDAIVVSLNVEIDFSSTRAIGANFGCLLDSNNERSCFFRGGIRNVRFFNHALNDCFAQNLYRSITLASQ